MATGVGQVTETTTGHAAGHRPEWGTDTHDGVLDLLADGVVLADESGTVTEVNATARQLLRTPADTGDANGGAGVGAHLAEVVLLQDRAGNSWYDCTQPYAGLTTRSRLTEQAWYLADGTELLVTARLLRDGPGRPVRCVAVSLRSARARERLDRERSDLVATVAHELRSPLTGVKGFVATLLSKWDKLNDAQKKMMLETVNVDADRLTRLIAELLDVARIDTGRLPLYPREVDTRVLVERCADLVRAGTSRPVETSYDEPVPRVFADPDKLTQVVTNLIDNAVRHGEGTVRVQVSSIDSPYAGALIRVDDEGDGIEETIRARVFTKFWKHGIRGGTGLGMYIVHGLVRVHGGEVTIGESDSGGARLEVRWPSDDRR